MAIYHLSIQVITRGKGKSAVAAAAYRAGETIINHYDNTTHNYSKKRGIVQTEILLPDHDENGGKIYDKSKRQYKCKSVPSIDWNDHVRAEEWREAWANSVNAVLEKHGYAERIDHRSYERQGVEYLPTIHLGAAAHQYEAAERYLKKHMNGHVFSAKTIKAWKSEQSSLTIGKSVLNQQYAALKDEAVKVERIKRNIENLLRDDSRESQPKRKHGLEL